MELEIIETLGIPTPIRMFLLNIQSSVFKKITENEEESIISKLKSSKARDDFLIS